MYLISCYKFSINHNANLRESDTTIQMESFSDAKQAAGYACVSLGFGYDAVGVFDDQTNEHVYIEYGDQLRKNIPLIY